MSTLAYILVFTFISSLGSLAGGFILLAKRSFALRASHFLTAFAAGVLLASAFLDLLPEALRAAGADNSPIFAWTLAGLLIFFLAEHLVHWFHHHDEHLHHHEPETKATLPLIIAGDALHNFVDGMAVAAAFLVNAPLGIATALAVAAHEIPQEIGDFALMLNRGMAPQRVVRINVASAAVSFAGALLVYALGDVLARFFPALLSLVAGFFIYIASSDLIPEIHSDKRRGVALAKSGFLIAGVLLFLVISSFAGQG